MPPAIMAYPDLRSPFDTVDVGTPGGTTVLFNDKTVVVERVLKEPGLWVSPEDLTRVNGFVLKSEGACLDDLCIPVKQDSDLLRTIDNKQWFSISAFADLMEQSYVVDEETNTWSFGEIPAKRQAMLTEAHAPEFEILDRQGRVVRMSDFKGKKALVITWSSW